MPVLLFVQILLPVFCFIVKRHFLDHMSLLLALNDLCRNLTKVEVLILVGSPVEKWERLHSVAVMEFMSFHTGLFVEFVLRRYFE